MKMTTAVIIALEAWSLMQAQDEVRLHLKTALPNAVTPAQAGVQKSACSGFRRSPE